MSIEPTDPPKVWQWVRWDDPAESSDDRNKWHLAAEDSPIMSTVCGKTLPLHDDPQTFQSEFIPEDEYGVCLTCLRFREMQNRDAENQ